MITFVISAMKAMKLHNVITFVISAMKATNLHNVITFKICVFFNRASSDTLVDGQCSTSRTELINATITLFKNSRNNAFFYKYHLRPKCKVRNMHLPDSKARLIEVAVQVCNLEKLSLAVGDIGIHLETRFN